MIPHATGHTSQFMDLVMAATATTTKPTGCSYKSEKCELNSELFEFDSLVASKEEIWIYMEHVHLHGTLEHVVLISFARKECL